MVTVLTLPKLPVFLWLLWPCRWLRLHIHLGKIRERTHQQFYIQRLDPKLFLIRSILSFWIILPPNILFRPISVAPQSKAWVYGRSLAGIAGLNPAGCMDVCLLWVLYVVGLCDRSITRPEESECGVSECDLETSTMKRRRPNSAVEAWKKNISSIFVTLCFFYSYTWLFISYCVPFFSCLSLCICIFRSNLVFLCLLYPNLSMLFSIFLSAFLFLSFIPTLLLAFFLPSFSELAFLL
jgi:hypothetical protein